jgi:Domain of unknown function (DUF397)
MDGADVGRWRKSSYSNSGACVEVGTGPAVAGVRDTRLQDSPVLTFGSEAWGRFVLGLKADAGVAH